MLTKTKFYFINQLMLVIACLIKKNKESLRLTNFGPEIKNALIYAILN